MNKKIIAILGIAILIIGIIVYFLYTESKKQSILTVPEFSTSTLVYKNNQFGFNFTLPISWSGYSVVGETWAGTPLKNTAMQTGSKVILRNPKWTTSLPYEDLPLLVFTLPQWNAYLLEEFTVSAAPIMATELGRNTRFVFALPPRWNFDARKGYEEATEIMQSEPLEAFDLR